MCNKCAAWHLLCNPLQQEKKIWQSGNNELTPPLKKEALDTSTRRGSATFLNWKGWKYDTIEGNDKY